MFAAGFALTYRRVIGIGKGSIIEGKVVMIRNKVLTKNITLIKGKFQLDTCESNMLCKLKIIFSHICINEDYVAISL